MTSADVGAASARQGVRGIAACGLERRRQCEQQRRDDADSKRKQDQARIDLHVSDARQIGRGGPKGSQAPARERQSGD